MADSVSAVVATLIAMAFGLSTFDRFLARRNAHELVWSLALFMFAIASASLAVGASAGWSGPTFRLFYLFGGVVNVPFLATGSIYLLFGRRAGDISAWLVSLGSAFAAGVIATAPFHSPLPVHQLAQGAKVLPGLPEVLAAVGSGAGSIVLIGGAIYSAIRVRQRRVVLSNVTIALGTLITGASGLMNSVFDKMTAFSIALGVGIAVIFVGFLLSTRRPTDSTPAMHPETFTVPSAAS